MEVGLLLLLMSYNEQTMSKTVNSCFFHVEQLQNYNFVL